MRLFDFVTFLVCLMSLNAVIVTRTQKKGQNYIVVTIIIIILLRVYLLTAMSMFTGLYRLTSWHLIPSHGLLIIPFTPSINYLSNIIFFFIIYSNGQFLLKQKNLILYLLSDHQFDNWWFYSIRLSVKKLRPAFFKYF